MLSIAKCKSVRQNKIFHFCLALVQEVPEYIIKKTMRTSVINIQELRFCGIFCHVIKASFEFEYVIKELPLTY